LHVGIADTLVSARMFSEPEEIEAKSRLFDHANISKIGRYQGVGDTFV
jgi:hypothetical protein